MRLIDADKLILHLNDYALQEAPGDNESTGERRLSMIAYNVIQNCIKSIEQQPTAFDSDKAVEQLETRKTRTAALQEKNISEYFEGETDAFEFAIKIVKGGGAE